MVMNPGIATAARGMGARPVPGGIATPMMAQPMMAQPMMAQPTVAQPMMAGQPMAQPAASQGLASAVAPLRGLPSKALLPIFAANPNFATLAALSEAQKQEQIAAQVRGQQAIEAAKQMQGSVAEDLVRQVASSGVGGQPYGFARGGIVAFDKGGKTAQPPFPGWEDPLVDENGNPRSASGRAAVEWRNSRRQAAYEKQQEAKRRAEQAPRPLSSLSTSTGVPIQSVRAAQEWNPVGRGAGETAEQQAEREARQGQEPVVPRESFVRQASQASEVSEPAPVTSQAPAATTTPVRPAARLPGAGLAGAGLAGAGPARPPAATAGTAAPDDPYGLRAASADMFKTMQGAGTVSDEEKQFRQALLEAMQAERQPPQEYKEPKGVSGRELLELAGSLNLEKGEGFGSLARGAAGILEKREAKKAEAMKANREIDAANRKLRTAVAQQRLAYASGDRQAKQVADAAVAKARFELREKEIAAGQRDRQIAAQERTARAAENRSLADGKTVALQIRVLENKIREKLKEAKDLQYTDPEKSEQAKAEAEELRKQALALAGLVGIGGSNSLSAEDLALINKYSSSEED